MGIGLLFLIALPAVLYVTELLLGLPMLGVVIVFSLVIGAIIEIGFGCVLILELRQDRMTDRFYKENPYSMLTPQQILDVHRQHKND